MASFELLDCAANGFETRLRLVTDAQRTLPTPCPEFNVHDLAAHQVRDSGGHAARPAAGGAGGA
jgi:Mycothiol maleylpyruvate isomerase N-terminal domain